jgi:hypothetical protein
MEVERKKQKSHHHTPTFLEWMRHYRTKGHLTNSRACRYCHPEEDKCLLDTKESESVAMDPLERSFYSSRLKALLRSEMRHRNKWRPLHFTQHLNLMKKSPASLWKKLLSRLKIRLATHHPRDGRQTPYVKDCLDVTAHFLGMCCRGCLSTWYNVPIDAVMEESQWNSLCSFQVFFLQEMTTHSQLRHFLSEQVQPNGDYYNWKLVFTGTF